MHRQSKTLGMPFDVPARESGLPHQFLDDASPLMKPAVVVSAHVGVVLRLPNVFELCPASPLGTLAVKVNRVGGHGVMLRRDWAARNGV
jgi:hypothetical protein